jgi:hypothetical protein
MLSCPEWPPLGHLEAGVGSGHGAARGCREGQSGRFWGSFSKSMFLLGVSGFQLFEWGGGLGGWNLQEKHGDTSAFQLCSFLNPKGLKI